MESWTGNSGRKGIAIPFILAFAALAPGARGLRASGQQAKPAAAAASASQGNTAQAEKGAPSAQTPTLKAFVELVNVPITATTKRGQRVIDLDKDDVRVFEDGVAQKITHFERETRVPLRIGLIVDTSNSARPKLPYEKDAAQQFVDTILNNSGTKTQVFLETFDSTSSIVQDFTYDPDVLSEKIQDLKTGGGKALYDAIHFACREKLMKTGPAEEIRRVLVVISDGVDVQSQHTLDQTVSMARMAETMIYTVGTAAYGFSNPGDKILEALVTDTGGSPLFPLRDAPGTDLESGYLSHKQIGSSSQNEGEGAETGELSAARMAHLVGALQAIGRDLSEQYLISYKPTRDALDATYRTIKIETTRRGVVLRWKPGYFAGPE